MSSAKRWDNSKILFGDHLVKITSKFVQNDHSPFYNWWGVFFFNDFTIYDIVLVEIFIHMSTLSHVSLGIHRDTRTRAHTQTHAHKYGFRREIILLFFICCVPSRHRLILDFHKYYYANYCWKDRFSLSASIFWPELNLSEYRNTYSQTDTYLYRCVCVCTVFFY